jgi:hypothetical protein
MCLHGGALVQEGHQGGSCQQSARCTAAGEAAPLPWKHARLTQMHLERDSVLLVLMSLPLGVSATGGAVVLAAGQFATGQPCPFMHKMLPQHIKALDPGTDNLDGTL